MNEIKTLDGRVLGSPQPAPDSAKQVKPTERGGEIEQAVWESSVRLQAAHAAYSRLEADLRRVFVALAAQKSGPTAAQVETKIRALLRAEGIDIPA